MNGEEDFHVENTEETKKSQYGFCILLLDCDATRLVNQSEILRKCGYRVVATTRADELPFIIHNKDDKIDLVLAELCLVKMNKYELLEKIRSICEIPVVVAGANVKKTVILDCLCRGAEFCLTKPLMKCNLENLWQFIVRSQRDFFSQIDTKVHEREYSITHTQFLGDELNQKNKNSEVKKEDLDDYKGDNSESGEQKKPELTCPGMQKEFRETDDQLSQGQKRKERMDTDTGEHTRKDYDSALGDQKKPKLICADDLQNETLDSIPNTEEGENERKEPTEIQKNEEESVNYEFDEIKEQPELVCMEVELEKWSTQPVTDFASYVQYEFQEQDFQPLESVGESTGHLEIPLSPRESSNKNVVGQTHGHGELDEEVMQDGISLADLEFDLFEGHVSTSDLDKKATRDLFDEIFTDLANQLKP